jgi:hypothetical protein
MEPRRKRSMSDLGVMPSKWLKPSESFPEDTSEFARSTGQPPRASCSFDEKSAEQIQIMAAAHALFVPPKKLPSGDKGTATPSTKKSPIVFAKKQNSTLHQSIGLFDHENLAVDKVDVIQPKEAEKLRRTKSDACLPSFRSRRR